MNGKRDHVSSVAARARVSDKSGLFHCISAHQGYKRDFRISCKSVPMQVPDPPKSSKMKSHWRLTAIWTPKSRLAPLLNPFGFHLAPQEFPKTCQKASQREVPERPKPSKMKSQRRLGATLAPRPLLASSLDPLWHPLGGTRRPQDLPKAPKIEPKGSLNESQTRQNHC